MFADLYLSEVRRPFPPSISEVKRVMALMARTGKGSESRKFFFGGGGIPTSAKRHICLQESFYC